MCLKFDTQSGKSVSYEFFNKFDYVPLERDDDTLIAKRHLVDILFR